MRRALQVVCCISFIFASFLGFGALHAWLANSSNAAGTRDAQGSATDGRSNKNNNGKNQLTDKLSAEATDALNRELILHSATKVSKKDDGKESKVILNDPNIPAKWGFTKTQATKAWEISQGSKDIIVAVIDTGADINHRDIAENLWVNPGENGKDSKGRSKASNGVDDDGNGYIDDVNGWNFVANNNNLTDTHGHGTHIAGIVGARGGNGYGISGLSPNVSLMVLKYYDPNTNNLKNTIKAIKYAVQMKAHIINYSGGGIEFSAEEYASIKQAERRGVLFISAAGNEKSNSDEKGKHYYPADYDLTNIISVTAINEAPVEKTQVLSSSNYGVSTVDLAAPGENIYSTLPGNAFGLMTGTSQATAFVTGVAALIMAHNRDFSAIDVKKYILKTGDEHPSLVSKTGSSKVLNSYKALTNLDVDVAATGVVASNTATMPKKSFSSDGASLNDRKLAPSVFGTSSIESDEEGSPDAFAGFSKELLKVMKQGPSAPTALEGSEPSNDKLN